MSNRFPGNFLWGSATSPHQVEGNNTLNDWWKWETDGNIEPSGKACGHYDRFREDFALAKELGHNTHRLGLEWSRLEQEEGVWDQPEWDHYKTVIDELLKLNITPIVTLNHFTVPIWFSHKNSWLNDESVGIFTRFAMKAIEELGDRVQYWITINEPNILAILGYYWGEWPPGNRNYNEMLIVLKNMVKSHCLIYHEMYAYAENNNEIKKPKIGIAKAVTAFHPCSRYSIPDRLATYNRSLFHNYSFILSAINGRIRIPGLKKEKLAVKKAMDFIGLNYYFRQFIHHNKPFKIKGFGDTCSLEHHPSTGETTDMGWEIYPKGLYEVVKAFSKYKLPIIITENGLATTDDSCRISYIKEHLKQLLRAINEGAPVTGYLHWSLMDNFEWAEGYSKKFGLINIDFTSQKRTIRDSARYYKSTIQTGTP